MTLKNTADSYGWLSKLLHWGMFIIIAGMLYTGFTLDENNLYFLHKSFGFLILMLVGLRIIWKMKNITPELPKETTPIKRKAAEGLHHLLYLIMVIFPFSGIVGSIAGGYNVPFFGLFSISKWDVKDKELAGMGHLVHEVLAYTICAVLVIHIAAALYHHFIEKDNILTRMLPFSSKKP